MEKRASVESLVAGASQRGKASRRGKAQSPERASAEWRASTGKHSHRTNQCHQCRKAGQHGGGRFGKPRGCLGEALGDLGKPWGTFWEPGNALEGRGDVLGGPSGRSGTPWEALLGRLGGPLGDPPELAGPWGGPSGRTVEKPWKNLLIDLPEVRVIMKALNLIIF